MSAFVEDELAPLFGMAAGWIYVAFAFQPTIKRATIVATASVIWIFGVTYVWQVRTDLTGLVVFIICGGICYLIARPIWREKWRG